LLSVPVIDDDIVNLFLTVGADLGHSDSLTLAAMYPLTPAWLKLFPKRALIDSQQIRQIRRSRHISPPKEHVRKDRFIGRVEIRRRVQQFDPTGAILRENPLNRVHELLDDLHPHRPTELKSTKRSPARAAK